MEAYDFYLRGIEFFLRLTKEANIQARQMFERAIALDPKYATAYAFLAYNYWVEWFFQLSQDPQTLKRAGELAQRAIALDDSTAPAHLVLGSVYLLEKQLEQAIAEAERVLTLNPNNAFGFYPRGTMRRSPH